jgi:hypothetical protein
LRMPHASRQAWPLHQRFLESFGLAMSMRKTRKANFDPNILS